MAGEVATPRDDELVVVVVGRAGEDGDGGRVRGQMRGHWVEGDGGGDGMGEGERHWTGSTWFRV